MKRILCYGDSNTWGHDPASLGRLPKEARWPGVLQSALGEGYEVLEEGLCGRTTVWDDPIEGYKNGREYLIPCLESHRPLDLVVLMLGTNDLKMRFGLPAFDIAEGAKVLVEIILASQAGVEGQALQVLLLAPPPTRTATLRGSSEMFEGADAKSARFSVQYKRVAQETGCALLDTEAIIVSSSLDGIHLEASEHGKLGQAVALKVKQLLE